MLIHVSMGYPSVTDRLHTRYSPVRRSSARYCYPLLPLDLHVLSLSLAFILSQDQTLHSKKNLLKSIPLPSYCSLESFILGLALAVLSLQYVKELLFLHLPPPSNKSESDRKDRTIYYSLQIFTKLFLIFF